jgi:O-antigen/teichoic acid export membrane protein
MNVTSIKVRFLATMTTNVLKAGISFITGLAIARHLGPEGYGHYSFLLGSFTAMISLVDMGTSSAFYTFISRKSRGKLFYLYYGFWVLVRFSLLLFFVLLAPAYLRERIWLGHTKELMLLALLAVFSMNQIWQFAGQVGESIRDTVGVQARNLILVVSFLICILLLIKTNLLSIRSLFLINIALYFVLACLYGVRLYRSPVLISQKNESFKDILREFEIYCAPLLLYTVVGFIYTLGDYWLLQRFAGAVQQGYYAVGSQFAAISLLATTSIIQVFWKEIAEANAHGNMARMQVLYNKVSRTLYFVGALASCILIPFSREVITMLLGPDYASGWPVFALMLFYPIHQALGQIAGTMLFALGRTRTKSLIGLIFMGMSVVMTVIFLAPRTWVIPGLQLGATGLALKMVICQLFDVTLMGLYVSRYISAQYDWLYQVYVVLLLLSGAFISKLVALKVLAVFNLVDPVILTMVVATFLYLSFASILLWHRPAIAGVESVQIRSVALWIRRRITLTT